MGGGGGGGRLGLNHARMCVCPKVKVLFRVQLIEMNEKLSFKMGVNLLLHSIWVRLF